MKPVIHSDVTEIIQQNPPWHGFISFYEFRFFEHAHSSLVPPRLENFGLFFFFFFDLITL